MAREAIRYGSILKGNTVLGDAISSVLDQMTAEDFNDLMQYAISVQPLQEG